MPLALVPPCMPAENPRRPAGGRAAKARVRPRVRVASTPADAVARISPAGDVVRATGSLAKMLGHADLRCLVGANIAELCAKPWDGSRLLTRLVDETSVRNYRMGLRCADGAVLAVRIDARGVRDRRGKLRSVEVELRDASRTKKGERKAPRSAAARLRPLLRRGGGGGGGAAGGAAGGGTADRGRGGRRGDRPPGRGQALRPRR